LNPDRLTFLRNLKARLDGIADLHWQSGSFPRLFPRARLVLNHCISGDLNFRVMEALGCGACLLTPRVRNGQSELFKDGQDLFMFDQSPTADWGELVGLIKTLLQNPPLCAQTAASGLEKVNAGHLAIHRAQAFSDAFSGLLSKSGGAAALVAGRLARQAEIRKTYLKLIYLLLAESEERPALRQVYLAAAKSGK
ncbi:MAG: glycosyltransferase, partial [Deltaproteobacteria bacterium]|nr:glycosyltransferase [Deltaproteobacteria bacterium]